MSNPAEPVLIAGGGIAGLASALALARTGRPVRVLERRAVDDESGAGIQLGPNGVRVLQALGLADSLRDRAGTPDCIVVRNARSARLIAELPLGAWIAARHGAPYWTLQRADLHDALRSAAMAHPSVEIARGFAVGEAGEVDGGVRVRASSGEEITGAALIAADGLWSRIRQVVAAGVEPRFRGKSASRAVVAAHRLSPPFDRSVVNLWLAPSAHIVHYPVSAGAEIAFVVVVDDRTQAQGWSMPVAASEILRHLDGVSPVLRDALAGIGTWRRWSLAEMQPLPRWSRGRIVLAGDAAHPVLPFLAQGGALALEDGFCLAHAMASRPDSPAEAFAAYATSRMARAARVQRASRQNGRRYHWSPLLAAARDAVLRIVPGEHLLASYDWLYGYRPGPPDIIA